MPEDRKVRTKPKVLGIICGSNHTATETPNTSAWGFGEPGVKRFKFSLKIEKGEEITKTFRK